MANLKALAYSTLTALGLTGANFSAPEGLSRVGCAVGCMCQQLMGVLPVVSMLMIIGAGCVYAIGQMMGAETRSRATTWGQAMLIGAIIGILIVVVAPAVLNILYAPTNTNLTIQQSICDNPGTIFTGCTCT